MLNLQKTSQKPSGTTITTNVTQSFYPGPNAFFQAKLNSTSWQNPPLLCMMENVISKQPLFQDKIK
jgi:hypothetical protein